MYTLVLDDGTTFSGLSVNGSYFVSKVEVSSEAFANFRGKYRVLCDGEDEAGIAGEYSGKEFLGVRKYVNGWYIGFADADEEVREVEQLRADVEYLAMKVGVELE